MKRRGRGHRTRYFGTHVAVAWLPVNQRWAVLLGAPDRPLHAWSVHYPTYDRKADAEKEATRIAYTGNNPLSGGATVALVAAGVVAAGGLLYALTRTASAATPPKKLPPEPPPPGAVKHPVGPGDVSLQVQTNQAVDASQVTGATASEVQTALDAAMRTVLPNTSYVSYLLIPGADPTQAPFLWDVAGTLPSATTLEDLNAAFDVMNPTTSAGPLTIRILPNAVVPTSHITGSGVSIPAGGGKFDVHVQVSGMAPTPQDFVAYFFPSQVLGATQGSDGSWVVMIQAPATASGELQNETSTTQWGTMTFTVLSIAQTQ